MQKLLCAIVAAAFAVGSSGAIAQSKDVTTKDKGAVGSKGGPAVTTKDQKDAPKPEAKPAKKKSEPAPAKPKEKGSPVTTKSGGDVTSKDKKGVESKSK